MVPYSHSNLILKEVIRIYFNLTTDASIHHCKFISCYSDGLICKCPHTHLCQCCAPCSDGFHLLSSEIMQSSIHFPFQPVWSMPSHSTGPSLNIISLSEDHPSKAGLLIFVVISWTHEATNPLVPWRKSPKLLISVSLEPKNFRKLYIYWKIKIFIKETVDEC